MGFSGLVCFRKPTLPEKPYFFSLALAKVLISTLYSSLKESFPPSALVNTAQLPYWMKRISHAVVVVGMEGNQIYLNDPAFPDAPKVIPTSDFELA